MSQQFSEGNLTFSFPSTWLVCRPEKTSFYVRHFQGFCNGCKEMDFLAFDPGANSLWLIEVKDYRQNPRTKQEHLVDEVAEKTRDILAMLPVASIRDNSQSQPEKLQVGEFWRQAQNASTFRVVLHCELPNSPSKLFPGVKDAANLQTKLKQKLHMVDPHAKFTNRGMNHQFGWTTR